MINSDKTVDTRRHDLDALRAFAMLLGIVLHTILIVIPESVAIEASREYGVYGLVFYAIHGFRMPLFFVMSGFFTAMLWRKRGMKALLKHRFRRIFLPLALGMLTIIPLGWAIGGIAEEIISQSNASSEIYQTEKSDVWQAAGTGNIKDLEAMMSPSLDINAPDPILGLTPLQYAVSNNEISTIEWLLQNGGDVNATGRKGDTPLHMAAFLHDIDGIKVLLSRGAVVNAIDNSGAKPLDAAKVDIELVKYVVDFIGIQIDDEQWVAQQPAVIEILTDAGGTASLEDIKTIDTEKQTALLLLFIIPFMGHLWFLWILLWLIVLFAIAATLFKRIPIPQLPGWLALSPARYLWLIPLTWIFQNDMGAEGLYSVYGPDTAAGLLPLPHMLLYYAIFFFFGMRYYDRNDLTGRISKWWRIELTIGLVIVFPLGFEAATGFFGLRDTWFESNTTRYLSILLQSTFPWLMTFGLMGLFRKYFSSENARVRYVSDSSYWLYLAHMVVITAVNMLLFNLQPPKFVMIILVLVISTALLLLSYEYMVRYKWLGKLLNGPRERPAKVDAE